MKEAKKPRGRPPKPMDEKLVQRSIRMTDEQWAEVDAQGLDWLRKLVDKARAKRQ